MLKGAAVGLRILQAIERETLLSRFGLRYEVLSRDAGGVQTSIQHQQRSTGESQHMIRLGIPGKLYGEADV